MTLHQKEQSHIISPLARPPEEKDALRKISAGSSLICFLFSLFFFGRAKLLRLFFIFRPRLCGKRGTRRRKGRGRRRLYCCTEQREKCNPGEKESSSFSPFPQPFFLVCGGRASASWLCSIFPIPFLQGSSLFPPGGEGGRRRHNTPSLMPTNQPTSASSLSIRFCTRLREGKKPATSGQ